MAVRSRRLFGPTVITNALAAIYTVPAGRTAIVRTTWIYNQNVATQNVRMTVNGTAVSDSIGNFEVPAGRGLQLGVELVLNPGDVLRAVASLNGAISVTMVGSLLLGAPE